MACNPTKKLAPNQYLVEKVDISGYEKTTLLKEDLEAFVRQKPNRKLFRSMHFFVAWYNLFNQSKIDTLKSLRNLKYDKINEERVKKNKLINQQRAKKNKAPLQVKLKDKDSPTMRESIRDIGEPPVILDSTLTEQTTTQLGMYLFSKGYFDYQVRDSISLYKSKRLKKRVKINYIIVPKKAYTISAITYNIADKKIAPLILSDTINRLIELGMNYDIDLFTKERQRITNFCLDKGYYYFENAYINFSIDSNKAGHSVSVEVQVKQFSRAYSSSNDSLVLVNHQQYRINNIYVITEMVLGKVKDAYFKDTIRDKHNRLSYLLNNMLPYRQALLPNYIDIKKGSYFNHDTAEITYKQLINLGIFKNVSIQFFKADDDDTKLDCYIICVPLLKQSVTAQTEGTNTSGNLGINGALVYNNRNFFKGGEYIDFKLQGSVAAQRLLNSDTTYTREVKDFTNIQGLTNVFNTISFGPEASFSVPRAFFPFSILPFKKEQSPRTFVKTSLNFVARNDFTRVISNISYGFKFKSHQNKIQHEIIPIEVLLIKATLSQSFKQTLAQLNDAFLVNSFQDHITTLSKYNFIYASKENPNTSLKPSHYLRVTLESSGNILREFFDLTGRQKDPNGRYLIFNVPFAQFLRVDFDYRFYVPIRKKSKVVYRVAAGVGKPLTNLNVMPYEQSFFSGGPNNNRAWRARSLGPGGYNPVNSNAKFDKIGDVLLEGNIEYRFHIIKDFNGAFFADAGNIWRLTGDFSKPNSQFLFNNFYNEIALGIGTGLRWDLSFLILRLDAATPIRDPRYPPGDRMTFNKKPWNNIILNFGIGYPF